MPGKKKPARAGFLGTECSYPIETAKRRAMSLDFELPTMLWAWLSMMGLSMMMLASLERMAEVASFGRPKPHSELPAQRQYKACSNKKPQAGNWLSISALF